MDIEYSTILGADGRPLVKSVKAAEEISGGWIQTGGIGATTPDLPSTIGLNRQMQRRKARIAFWTNHLIEASMELVHSFVFGASFNWGEIYDKSVRLVFDEFVAANDFTELIERWYLEYLMDGESAWLFPLERDDPGRNEPAIVTLPDVDYGISLDFNTVKKVYGLKAQGVGNNDTFDKSRFVWVANQALHNDPRGMPVIMRAVDPALAYVGILNHRLRQHELQNRVNAVYHALVDFSKGADVALKQHKDKAAQFGKIPKDGAVLTLARDRQQGTSEEMTFLEPGKGSSDAKNDAQLFALAVASAMKIPLFWLWTGESNNRSSGDLMVEATRRAFEKRQSHARNVLDKVLRLELKRRLGSDARVWVQRAESSSDGLTRKVSKTRVPIDQFFFPWSFPSLELRDLKARIAETTFLLDRKLLSQQSAAGRHGVDYAHERELMSADDLGNSSDPNAPKGGNPNG